MTYALLILLFLIFLVLLIDAWPQFMTWQSRIRIGRWSDKDSWGNAVERTAKKWLGCTPVIPVTDNTRLIIIDILKGNYKRKAIQHWQEAALLMGLTDSYLKSGSFETRKAIDAFLAEKFTPDGQWKDAPQAVDSAILAYAVMRLPWIEQDFYKPAYDEMYRLLESLTGADGTVAYRNHVSDYRFVDTIGFIAPFLVRYGVVFGNDSAIKLGCRQISTFNRFGMLCESFVPCHTYNLKNEFPAGLFGWARGLGWYAIGLIDAWKELPSDHLKKEELTDNVKSFAMMAMQFQNANGGWNWIVMHPGSRMDSSATATLSYFLSQAASIPQISGDCKSATDRGLKYLMSVTRRYGAIDFSQGDTKDIGVYSREFNILPFTQGFALRAYYSS